MSERYKCYVIINNEPTVFKRYGESEKEVQQDLENFIKSNFEGASFQVQMVEKDKTKTVKEDE